VPTTVPDGSPTNVDTFFGKKKKGPNLKKNTSQTIEVINKSSYPAECIFQDLSR
jgi:hypothetical protein